METPEQLIAKRISELPQYVRQAIGEAQATTKLRTIGNKYHLRIDQQMVMEREVMLVMLGFDTEGAFVRNLVSEAKIPLSDAQSIAGDVGGEIFSHIRDAMRKMSEERSKQPAAQTAPAFPASPQGTQAAKSVLPPSAAAPKMPPSPAPSVQQNTKPAVEPPQKTVAAPAASPIGPATPKTGTNQPAEAQEKTLAPVEQALAQTQTAPNTTVTVGLSATKSPGYSADPYREAIE